MANTNIVVIAGRLTRDPDLRCLATGIPVCEFSLAINRKTKDGHEKTTFVEVTAWRKTAELVKQYLTKGQNALVTGYLETNAWQDKQTGQQRSKLKVTANSVDFLDRPSQAGQDQGVQPAPPPVYNQAPPPVYNQAPPPVYNQAPPPAQPAPPPVYNQAPPPAQPAPPPVYNQAQPPVQAPPPSNFVAPPPPGVDDPPF